MISIKAVGLYSSDFSSGETRLGDAQIITDGTNYEVIDGYCGSGATRLISVLKAMSILAPYLHVSHAHDDHDNGIYRILNDSYFSPKGLYCYDPDSLKGGFANSEIKSDAEYLRKIINTAKAKEIPVHYVGNGDTIKHGEIEIKVYRRQPAYSGAKSDPHGWSYVNDGSLCYWFPQIRYLTTGDASLWAAYKYNLRPLIVKGGHHGNRMDADEWLKPSEMCPWLFECGCRFYWDNDFSTRLTDFLMTGREDAINAGMTFIDIHGDIDMVFAEGKVTIRHGSDTYTADVPYQGKMAEGSWKKGTKGWWYRFPDGSYATGWEQIIYNGVLCWFLFDGDGWMKTGWQKVNGKWYFMDYKTGAMKTGWHKLPHGPEKTEDWYLLDPKTGAMLTGWQWSSKDGKSGWYYLDPDSGMRIGWIFDGGYWYYLGIDGKMVTGWVTYKGRKCYLEPKSDSKHIQGRCYVSTTATIDGKTYRFDKDGYAEEITASGGNITQVSGKLNDISASRRQFVIDIANYVRRYAPQYGICIYSPVIAQAIHESGWGESKLSAKYHNYFGLKCGTKWTGKSVNMKTQEEYSAGSLSTISANFRAYDSMEEGVKGYFEFIQLARYSNLKGVTDPRQYLQNIKNDGYATGSQYVDHTMALVNLYNLTQFDGEAPAAKQPATQGQREAIVSEAISHIGVKEGTVLHHKIIDRYNSRKPLPRGYAVKYTDPWCATFISYLAIVMGYTDIIPVECGCPQMITLAKQMGIWVEDDSYVPKPGDIVLYDWQDSGAGDNTGNPDHIGIVEKVVGNTETVIEGNYQDSVKRRELAVNGRYIRGYIVPRYK